MVNYKRIVCEVAVMFVVATVAIAAPATDYLEKHFDQRQNGTENYRLNIDGVVIAVAPAESLLATFSDIDIADLLDLDDLGGEPIHKPKPPVSTLNKPDSETPSKPSDGPISVLEELIKPAEAPTKPVEGPLSDVSLNSELKSQKKSALRKQEKARRLKQRLASMLIPLLRKTRHH